MAKIKKQKGAKKICHKTKTKFEDSKHCLKVTQL